MSFLQNILQGKTNIIHQFIDKERNVSESSTFLLEYTYARQSGKSMVNIAEMGLGIYVYWLYRTLKILLNFR